MGISGEFQLLHESVTLVADVFFVNGMPFFIKLYMKIRVVTVKYIQYRSDNQISRSLNKACGLYASASYNIEVLLMDM